MSTLRGFGIRSGKVCVRASIARRRLPCYIPEARWLLSMATSVASAAWSCAVRDLTRVSSARRVRRSISRALMTITIMSLNNADLYAAREFTVSSCRLNAARSISCPSGNASTSWGIACMDGWSTCKSCEGGFTMREPRGFVPPLHSPRLQCRRQAATPSREDHRPPEPSPSHASIQHEPPKEGNAPALESSNGSLALILARSNRTLVACMMADASRLGSFRGRRPSAIALRSST